MKYIPADASEFVPASHEDPNKPGVLKRVIATAADLQSGTVPMVNWSHLPVGHSFALHYHEDMQEVFVLISGQVEMIVAGETIRMSPGDTVLVDPTEHHKMINTGESAAEYLVFGIASGTGGQTVIVDEKA